MQYGLDAICMFCIHAWLNNLMSFAVPSPIACIPGKPFRSLRVCHFVCWTPLKNTFSSSIHLSSRLYLTATSSTMLRFTIYPLLPLPVPPLVLFYLPLDHHSLYLPFPSLLPLPLPLFLSNHPFCYLVCTSFKYCNGLWICINVALRHDFVNLNS